MNTLRLWILFTACNLYGTYIINGGEYIDYPGLFVQDRQLKDLRRSILSILIFEPHI